MKGLKKTMKAKVKAARAVAWIIWNMALMLLAVCSLPLFIILVVWLDKWLDKM